MNARKMLAGFACLWIAVSSASATWTDGSGNVYKYASKIPIAYTASDALTDFPILVTLTPTNFAYAILGYPGSGVDLRFTDDARLLELPYELDSAWIDGGTNRVWVKVPSILSATNIYAVFGCAAASTRPSWYATNTWSANYQAVLHFSENTGTTSKDSSLTGFTGNLKPGTAPNYPLWTNGIAGSALWYDFTDDYFDTLKTPSSLGIGGSNDRTSEGWLLVESPARATKMGIFSMGNASTTGASAGGGEFSLMRMDSAFTSPKQNGWANQLWGSANADFQMEDLPAPSAMDQWVHVAQVYKNATKTCSLYINGVLGGSSVATVSPVTINTYAVAVGVVRTRGGIGATWWDTSGPFYFAGKIDEVRFSNASRPAGWYLASYQTVADPLFSPTLPMIDNQGHDGPGGTMNLHATLRWPASGGTVYMNWGDDNPGPGGAWDNQEPLTGQVAGAIDRTIGPLSANTTYYYWFSVVSGDNEGWAPSVGSFTTPASTSTVTIQATDATASEATPPTQTGTFTITRDGTTGPLTVNYALTGTAVEGSDYQAIVTKQVTIPDGQASATFTITPIDNYLFELTPKTVVCTLTTGSGYVTGAPDHDQLTITSDDVSALSGFRHSMPITVSGYTGSTLNNFPVLVKLSESIPGFHYSDFADPSAAGGDLRFVDSAQTTRLNYEIEKWDITGTSYVWVQVPALSAGTTIYAFWGNPDGTTPPTYSTDSSTWAGIYDGVYHLDGLTGAGLRDSSANHNNLMAVGATQPQERAGAVAGGIRFNAATEALTTDPVTTFDYLAGTPTAVELWVWTDVQTLSRRSPIGLRSGGQGGTRWSLHYDLYYEFDALLHKGRLGVYNNAVSDIYTDIQGKSKYRWYHLMMVDPGAGTSGQPTFYIDGDYAGQLPANSGFDYTKVGKPLCIGAAEADGTGNWMGRVDEVRISHHAHSVDWIRANYQTQSSSTFLTFGTVENLLTDTGATGLAVGGNVNVNATISGVPAWPVHAYLCWGTSDGGAAYPGTWDGGRADLGSQAGPGPVILSSSLPAGSGTTYYRFYVDSDLTQTWTPFETYAPATVSISATDGSATEDGVNGGTFEVTRSGVTDGPLTVRYTLGGTAANGADYTALSSNVTFAVGETTKTITVTPLADDMVNEGSETVVATLVNGGYELGTAVASVTIADSGSDLTSGWTKSVTFTLSGYAGGTELQNFPVLVRLSTAVGGFSYGDFFSASGGDLRFTDENRTQWLPHEIDTWNVAGESTVWVKLPRLSGTTTKIKAWWRNPSETTPPVYTTDGTVWTNGFAGVWHYRETGSSDPVDDSTANNFWMTPHGSPTIEAGPVGNGRGFSKASYKYFDGAGASENSFGATADGLGIGTKGAPFTFETMVNVNTSGGWIDGGLMWLGMHGNMKLKGAGIRTGTGTPNGQLCVNWSYGDFINATGIAGDTWLHVAAAYDGGTVGNNLRLYVNGAQVQFANINTLWDIYNTFPMQLGGWFYNRDDQNTLTGNLDESRVSRTSRSVEWIKASYDTINSASFATYPLPLTVTINRSGAAATEGTPINFTVVFSQAVNDFVTGDVTLGGTTGANSAVVTDSGDHITYNVAVSGMTSSGTVTAAIAAAVAQDAEGIANSVATTTIGNSVTYSLPRPATTQIMFK